MWKKISYVVLLIVAGYTLYYLYMGVNYYAIGPGPYDASQIAKIAIQKNDPSECRKIRIPVLSRIQLAPGAYEDEPGQIARCYEESTIVLRKLEACEDRSEKTKVWCIQGVLGKSQDPLLCQGFTAYSELEKNCYIYFFTNEDNPSMCENISEVEGRRVTCYASYERFKKKRT